MKNQLQKIRVKFQCILQRVFTIFSKQFWNRSAINVMKLSYRIVFIRIFSRQTSKLTYINTLPLTHTHTHMYDCMHMKKGGQFNVVYEYFHFSCELYVISVKQLNNIFFLYHIFLYIYNIVYRTKQTIFLNERKWAAISRQEKTNATQTTYSK